MDGEVISKVTDSKSFLINMAARKHPEKGAFFMPKSEYRQLLRKLQWLPFFM
jgi:hypothetical protein